MCLVEQIVSGVVVLSVLLTAVMPGSMVSAAYDQLKTGAMWVNGQVNGRVSKLFNR